jgi:hypothetical protein
MKIQRLVARAGVNEAIGLLLFAGLVAIFAQVIVPLITR